jgi:hypothetical protein
VIWELAESYANERPAPRTGILLNNWVGEG